MLGFDKISVGLFPEVLQLLMEKLNFSVTIVPSKDGKYGGLEEDKKTWNGLIGMLAEGEIDLSATDLTITSGRSEVVDRHGDQVQSPVSSFRRIGRQVLLTGCRPTRR